MGFIDIPTLIAISILFAFIDLFYYPKESWKMGLSFDFLINVLINFGIPFIQIWLLPQSGLPFSEQIQIFAEALITYFKIYSILFYRALSASLFIYGNGRKA